MWTTIQKELTREKKCLHCSFYLYRFRKYVSYGFPIIIFCNPGVHYETPCTFAWYGDFRVPSTATFSPRWSRLPGNPDRPSRHVVRMTERTAVSRYNSTLYIPPQIAVIKQWHCMRAWHYVCLYIARFQVITGVLLEIQVFRVDRTRTSLHTGVLISP